MRHREQQLLEGIDTMTKRCFVIGPIGPPEGAIRAAADDFIKYIVGPCVSELGFADPDRADRLPEPGRITSQIVELLQSADLVIADLSGNNENVYYELSCRHAIAKPVIHMAVEGTSLPFDVADNRTIFYAMHPRHVDRAKQELAAQIKRVLEPGYKPRNPILDAIGLIALERSTEPLGQTLATLVGDVQLLRGEVATLRDTMIANELSAIRSPGFGLGTAYPTGPTGPIGSGPRPVTYARPFGGYMDLSLPLGPSKREVSMMIQTGLANGDPPDRLARNITSILQGENRLLELIYLDDPSIIGTVNFRLLNKRDQTVLDVFSFPR